MKTVILLFLFGLIGGCSMIESDAGSADYSYTVTMADGSVHNVRLKNKKNIGLVSARMKYGDMEVELLEQGVDASGPMSVMAESNGKALDAIIGMIPAQ